MLKRLNLRPKACSTIAAGLMLVLGAAAQVPSPAFWTVKPAAEWTEQEARQILSRSPWSVPIVAGVARRLTEDQLREGGQMGQPAGVGFEGVDPKGSGPKVTAHVLTGPGGDDRSLRSLPGAVKLQVCWQSALPVRLASLKSHFIEPPVLETDGYQIAVYGVPGIDFKGEPQQIGEPLKKTAFLRREGQKDVRPARVEVFKRPEGLAVVYVFPLSAEISPRDVRVVFEAYIGRINVTHTFELESMAFLGKVEL